MLFRIKIKKTTCDGTIVLKEYSKVYSSWGRCENAVLKQAMKLNANSWLIELVH